MADQDRHGFLTPQAPINNNIELIEWFEQGRRILHAGSLELGIVSAEIDAQLRKVSRGILVAGVSSRYRAHMVSKPIAQSAEALVVASRYIITARNKFEAAFMPELEAAGYRPAGSTFKFKAS
jgi:hypothetical protein